MGESHQNYNPNNNVIALDNLVSEAPNYPASVYWNNDEPAVVEVEWKLMQDEFAVPDGANDYLVGNAEDLPMGDETVTRRYEFYQYTGPLDPVSNEAICDQLPPVDPAVDPSAKPECYTLGEAGLKGGSIGAQMAAFNVKAPLGTYNQGFEYVEINKPYTPRTIVIGGNRPYAISAPYYTSMADALPEGMVIDPNTGVLAGTPTVAGYHLFDYEVTDADGAQTVGHFHKFVIDPATPDSRYPLSVIVAGNGIGSVTGNSKQVPATIAQAITTRERPLR